MASPNGKTSLTDITLVNQRVIALREALGMKKAEFADAIGMDRSSLTKVEKFDKPFLPEYAFRAWEMWGIDMNYFYLGRLDSLKPQLSKKVTTHLTALQQ